MSHLRVPVAGIGRPTPPELEPSTLVEQMMGQVISTPSGPALDPGAFQNAPPWVSYLANVVQNLRVEIGAFKLALVRRGLMTEAEFAEALMHMARSYEEEFLRQMGQAERRLNQQPGEPAPRLDPRRSPT